MSFFSFEQRTALLDFISSEFRKRHQVTSFCSVGIEGTVAVEREDGEGGGLLREKVL